MEEEMFGSVGRRFSPLGEQVGALLRAQGWTMAAAESCTGGTIASMMTAVAGASAYFRGGVVTYAADVKQSLLGVDLRDGVVSESVARQMAVGVARLLSADCAVATTGVAGPGGATGDTPVGTVWTAATCRGTTVAQRRLFAGSREAVILQAADAALSLLAALIREKKQKNC